MVINSEYLNQPIDVSLMSTGTQRVIWLLANVFNAGCKGISLIGIEELEANIHPRLIKNLLEILIEKSIKTKHKIVKPVLFRSFQYVNIT